MKDRDRRPLRQHREAYKGPNLRKKPCPSLKNRTQLDSICEKPGEEDKAEEIVNARIMKTLQVTRESTEKKPRRPSGNTTRIKRVRKTGTYANGALRIAKW